MAGMLFDSEAAAQLEQAYATTDMIVQREELRRSLRASSGESILDLGSGPGFLACELALEVGATGRIVAVDISSDMNSIASKRIAAAGLGDRVDILKGDATALAFADAVFEAAVSTQVMEYLAEPDAACTITVVMSSSSKGILQTTIPCRVRGPSSSMGILSQPIAAHAR